MKKQSKKILIISGIIILAVIITSVFLFMPKAKDDFFPTSQSFLAGSAHIVDIKGVPQSAIQGGSVIGSHCFIDFDNNEVTCCDDSGYVFCDESMSVCGSSLSWCDIYNSGDGKYCNGNNCCTGGTIISYNYNTCCPAQAPNTADGRGCNSAMRSGVDNYYSRLSSCYGNGGDGLCFPFGGGQNVDCYDVNENKCEGFNSFLCERLGSSGDDKFIYQFKDKGEVLGKCGVECLTNANKCLGLNYSSCINNQWQDQGEQVGKCGVNCKTGTKEYLTCSAGYINDSFIQRECKLGSWQNSSITSCSCSDDTVCSKGFTCKNSDCVKKINWLTITLMLIGTIIVVILVIFLALIMNKKKK